MGWGLGTYESVSNQRQVYKRRLGGVFGRVTLKGDVCLNILILSLSVRIRHEDGNQDEI